MQLSADRQEINRHRKLPAQLWAAERQAGAGDSQDHMLSGFSKAAAGRRWTPSLPSGGHRHAVGCYGGDWLGGRSGSAGFSGLEIRAGICL